MLPNAIQIALARENPIASQEKALLILLRSELALLPECFGPFAHDLASASRVGPARFIVGGHADGACIQAHRPHFLCPDKKHISAHGLLQLLAPDAFMQVVVRATVWADAVEDEVAGAAILRCCELHQEVYVAGATRVLLHG